MPDTIVKGNFGEKGTWWSITAFDEGEQLQLSGTEYPVFVAKVYGGLEKCPHTGKVHFQGAVQCKSQQRFSAIKRWLPRSHIELARQADALKKYAMKEETSIGTKEVRENQTPYYTTEKLLCLLAVSPTSNIYSESAGWKDDFWYRVRHILYDKPYLVGALIKPDIIRAWEHTRNVWLDKMVSEENGQPLTYEEGVKLLEGPIVLQAPVSIDLLEKISVS